jgi:hypothetical protein
MPKMLAGNWQGTMALTEPQAGSSLADLTTEAIPSIAQSEGVEAYLADATVFLEFFGIITIDWQWLLQAACAQEKAAAARKKADRRFFAGKRHACDYFFKYELPKTVALARTLMDRRRPTLEIAADQF